MSSAASNSHHAGSTRSGSAPSKGGVELPATSTRFSSSGVPLSTTHLITEASTNKITFCNFHHVLPWICFIPKHGHILSVWDYVNHKMINEILITDVLSVQRPHPSAVLNPGIVATWTPELVGKILSVSFLDEECLMWLQFLSQNNSRNDSAVEREIVGAMENRMFGSVGPHYGDGSVTRILTIGAGQASPLGSEEETSGDKNRDSSLLVICENVVLILSVGTATLYRSLLSSQVQNRIFCSNLILPVCSIYNPLIFLGCNDGRIIVWDPFLPATAENATVLRDPKISIVHTPHSSRINTLTQYLYLPSPPPTPSSQSNESSSGGKGAVNSMLQQFRQAGGGGGPSTSGLNINWEGFSSLRGAYLSIVIGTEGGSVTHLRFQNRDEVSVEFSTKKVHDSVLSVCSSPQPLLENHVDSSGIYQDAISFDAAQKEFVHMLSQSIYVYSLGPQYLIMQDGKTGAEVRKLKTNVNGNLKAISLIPGPNALLVVTASSAQYQIDYSLTKIEDLALFCSVRELLSRSVEVSSSGQGTNGVSLGLPPGSWTSSTYAAERTSAIPTHSSSGLAPLFDFNNVDGKAYAIQTHPLRPAAFGAICTNCGVILFELSMTERGSSNVGQSFVSGQTPSANQLQQQFHDAHTFGGIHLIHSKVGLMFPSGATGSQATAKNVAFSSVPTTSLFHQQPESNTAIALPQIQSECLTFAHLDSVTGKVCAATLQIPFTAMCACEATQLLLPMVAEIDTKASLLTQLKKNVHIIDRQVIAEANSAGGCQITSLVPSPCHQLVAALTDTREIRLYDVAHNFAQLTVPTMNRADKLVWSATTSAFAVFSRDTRKISIAPVRKQQKQQTHQPNFTVSSVTHDVIPANVPIDIVGGRWLCVHYQASFSGLASQFYKWESSMAGGGAIGGFIPQPLFLEWNPTATLCALAYQSSIVFMETKRKVFSQLCSVEITTPPSDILFVHRCLFVMFEREILLLLPTKTIVQKVIVAAINPAVVTHTLNSAAMSHYSIFEEATLGGRPYNPSQHPSDDQPSTLTSSSSSQHEYFSYKIALRPPGTLKLRGVIKRHSCSHANILGRNVDGGKKEEVYEEDASFLTHSAQHALALIVNDENLNLYLIPLSRSLSQLLLHIHLYSSSTATKADRIFVQRCLLSTATGCSSSAVASGSSSTGLSSGSMFVVAVQHFCQQCGCDVIERAAELGLFQLDSQHLQQQATTGTGNRIAESSTLGSPQVEGGNTNTATATSASSAAFHVSTNDDVDLQCVEMELQQLDQVHVRQYGYFSRAKIENNNNRCSTMMSSFQNERAQLRSCIVNKLLDNTAERHAAGWITLDKAIKISLTAVGQVLTFLEQEDMLMNANVSSPISPHPLEGGGGRRGSVSLEDEVNFPFDASMLSVASQSYTMNATGGSSWNAGQQGILAQKMGGKKWNSSVTYSEQEANALWSEARKASWNDVAFELFSRLTAI